MSSPTAPQGRYRRYRDSDDTPAERRTLSNFFAGLDVHHLRIVADGRCRVPAFIRQLAESEVRKRRVAAACSGQTTNAN